ncbi:peptidase inhibitor family I36 protein [Protofrankia symbiont of Coriaria ruscifolia]|uniref:peptidase inhibitor family I36 protein n=1 Tax=Protofrankia symbiont of Coriaria ruscifolia TaxID=1306542 RepID=UPI001041651C|nr:peptidase inhibitor family I36 protein [Protofrankia symbiont of Coriaria ruscifolia]
MQISPNEIAWDGGKVVMVFPWDGEKAAPTSSTAALGGPISTSDIYGCPTQYFGADYYCFYEHIDWGGRRLQFKDYPQNINFSNYGFDNETSSWVNGGAGTINVYDQPYVGTPFLWTEVPHFLSSWVGDANNDRAESFSAY